jgi:hypothetical protein
MLRREAAKAIVAIGLLVLARPAIAQQNGQDQFRPFNGFFADIFGDGSHPQPQSQTQPQRQVQHYYNDSDVPPPKPVPDRVQSSSLQPLPAPPVCCRQHVRAATYAGSALSQLRDRQQLLVPI